MEDIGQKLREARQEKGLSIPDVEEQTKIQRRYLEAIEKSDFDQLPGDFYARAFIKQYAEVVGLNGNELLSDFHSSVPTTQPEEYVENSNENKVQRVKETTNNKKGIWKNYIPQALTVAGVLVVLGIIYLIYANVFANPNKSSTPSPEKVIVNSQVDESKKSSKSSAETKKNKSKNDNTLKITKNSDVKNSYTIANLPTTDTNIQISSTTNNVWTEVLLDDQVAYQGMISAGNTQSVSLTNETKSIKVNLGNTLSVQIKIAGQVVNLEKAADPNVPLNLEFTVKPSANQDK